MKLAIIVGHGGINREGKKDLGSYGVDPLNCFEYEWYKPLAQEMYRLARGLGLKCHVFTRDNSTIAKVGEAVNTWAKDDVSCAIELHWNSFNGNVMGTETWYDLDPISSEDFAKEIHAAMIGVLERKKHRDPKQNKLDRGPKILGPGERGFKNAVSVKIPYALVEPVFADVTADAQLLFNKRIALAISLVSAAHKFLSNQSASVQVS